MDSDASGGKTTALGVADRDLELEQHQLLSRLADPDIDRLASALTRLLYAYWRRQQERDGEQLQDCRAR